MGIVIGEESDNPFAPREDDGFRSWLQFSLRSLFLFTAAVAVALALWLRPYEVRIEKPGVFNVPMTATYTLRRTLLGGPEAYGQQHHRYPAGREVRWQQWGGAPDCHNRHASSVEFICTDGTPADEPVWEALIWLDLPR